MAVSIVKANELCDDLGIDTISGANAVSLAMELYEKGLITEKDTKGIKANFGNPEALVGIIELIAKREGIGDLLAEGMLGVIEKAILAANIGMTPINNGEVIRINVPPLTEERRHQLVKQVKQEGETAKISIRTGRKWFLDELKTLLKEGLPEDEEKTGDKIIQEMTDRHIARVDKVMEAKEKEIMTV